MIDDERQGWVAWAAGIVDGEGCIRLQRYKNGYFQLRIFVANTDPRLLLKLREVCGGTISTKVERGKPQHKPQWTWSVAGPLAETVLKELLPWLVGKRDQAELGIASRAFIGRRGQTDGMTERRIALTEIDEQLRAMKRVRHELH